MYKIDFENGCVAFVGKATYDRYMREVREVELKKHEQERADHLFAAMLRAEANGDWELYSDIHEDLFDIRPYSY